MTNILLEHVHQTMAEKHLGSHIRSLVSSGLRQTFHVQVPPLTCSMPVGKLSQLLRSQFPQWLYGHDYAHYKGHRADKVSYQGA